ncbi:MAG: hypothetical protein SFZ24_05765 [Planctomycetota bacterium]|nr:hypothetical protein [Planctomycetota bacterium]
MHVGGPTNPFHIARAYGVAAPSSARPPSAASPAPAQAPAATGRTPSNVQRLVAGVVPGRIDFSTPEPSHAAPTLQLYRHPADRNAAATAVNAGRIVDVRG